MLGITPNIGGNMKEYRIGEFAQAMNVNTDFLKYYEENDILHPFKNEENNYRYYTINQSRIVVEIKRLRSLGFSVSEIKQALTHDNSQELMKLYSNKTKEFEEKINEYKVSINYFEKVKKCLDYSNTENNFYITDKPAFYFLPHTNEDDYIDSQNSIYHDWLQRIPYALGSDRYYKENGTYKLQHGLIIEAEYVERFQLNTTNAIYVPQMRSFEIYATYTHTDTFEKEADLSLSKYQNELSIINTHNYTYSGDIYVDFIAFSHEQQQLYEHSLVHIAI